MREEFRKTWGLIAVERLGFASYREHEELEQGGRGSGEGDVLS